MGLSGFRVVVIWEDKGEYELDEVEQAGDEEVGDCDEEQTADSSGHRICFFVRDRRNVRP